MASTVRNPGLSTRVNNVLTNMTGPKDWPGLLDFYKRDPEEFETSFLRTPGAGRKSLDEFKTFIKPLLRGRDITHRVLWLSPEDVKEAQQAINEVLHSIHHEDPLAVSLRKIKAYLTAEVIHTRIS